MTVTAEPWSLFNAGRPAGASEAERLASAYRAEARQLADPNLFLHGAMDGPGVDRADALQRLARLHHAALRLASAQTFGATDAAGRPVRPDPMVELGLLWELVEPLGVTAAEACHIVAKEA